MSQLTNQVAPSRKTFQWLVTEAISEEMRRDENVFLMGFEVSHYKPDLRAEFGPYRVIDTPISELGVTGMAVGAARAGKRPIVDLIGSSFFLLAMDQIVNQAAVTEDLFASQLPSSLVIRGLTGIGEIPGAAHHCPMIHPMFMGVPGLRVVYPSCAEEAKGLMTAAIREPGPVLFFEHLRLYKTVAEYEAPSFIPLGHAAVRMEGDDCTVVAIGPTVGEALKAAQALRDEGCTLAVIDPRTLVPLDYETIIKSARHTHRLLVVDEAHETCSAASQIAATVAERLPGIQLQRLVVPNKHIPFSAARQWGAFSPTADKIATAVRNMLGMQNRLAAIKVGED